MKLGLSEISISLSFQQATNVFRPKKTPDLGILLEEKLHDVNASYTMTSTESGIVNEFKSRQEVKAQSLRDLTVFVI